MSAIFCDSGLALMVGSAGQVIPVIADRNYGTDELDGFFVVGDASLDRIDIFTIGFVDETDGTWEFRYTTGTPDVAPVAPATPAGEGLIAYVTVPAGATSFDNCTFQGINTGSNPSWGAWNGGSTVTGSVTFLDQTTSVWSSPGSSASFEVVASGANASIISAVYGSGGDVFRAYVNNTDNTQDRVSFFDGVFTRADRPTIDPTTATAQQVAQVLITLGLIIDGTPP